jgi:hypothetical protein
MAVALGLAAAVTMWVIAVVVSDLLREGAARPGDFISCGFWGWSGLSVLRWRTNLAIILLLLSTVCALPSACS